MTDNTPSQSVVFDLDLIRRYDKSGPRYTSYPTAVQFHPGFNEASYLEAAKASNEAANTKPLSLYFHIPFCDTVCFYCACNKLATKDRTLTSPYVERMYKELGMQGKLFNRDRTVEQLHWGGGTPTFLSHDQMRDLMRVTRENFTLRDDDEGEYSIEIDPREAGKDTIALLREIGFNRMSLGVQDFNADVQRAVNRIQPYDMTMTTMNAARDEGFKSISIDLIYGLPLQSIESFSKTLDTVLEINPNRMSLFNYAHLPDLFKPQRRIDTDQVPSPEEKLDILQMSIQRLTDAGYLFIGMDHFAKPDDELAVAQRERTLYRNFQGYSTHAECDLIGIGVTSIGTVNHTFSQNVKELDEYYEALDADHLPVMRGYKLDDDDLLRRHVITELICHFDLRFAEVEEAYGINFKEYFAVELPELEPMEKDGLLSLDGEGVHVEPAGKLLIRNICMVFDRYLREGRGKQSFSKVI